MRRCPARLRALQCHRAHGSQRSWPPPNADADTARPFADCHLNAPTHPDGHGHVNTSATHADADRHSYAPSNTDADRHGYINAPAADADS